MPGMAMTADVTVRALGTTGRYEVQGQYSMAGAWTFTLEWRGPRGAGRTTFDLEVQ